MLDRDDFGPLLEMITSAQNVEVQLAGLDAITRFELTEDAWRAVGPALRGVLAETTLGSPERGVAIELAAQAPLTSVRSQLTAIGEAPGDPDAARARRVLRQPSSGDVEQLLQRLESDPLDSGAAEELATLPIESVSHDTFSQRALKERLRRLARSQEPEVRFWISLTLARLGDNQALDQVLSGQGPDTSVFSGSPGVAYDSLARLRPIPGALYAHLMGWLETHPSPDPGPDPAALLAWALTGRRTRGETRSPPRRLRSRRSRPQGWRNPGSRRRPGRERPVTPTISSPQPVSVVRGRRLRTWSSGQWPPCWPASRSATPPSSSR